MYTKLREAIKQADSIMLNNLANTISTLTFYGCLTEKQNTILCKDIYNRRVELMNIINR